MAGQGITRFALYGDVARPLAAGFLHIETISSRSRRHAGLIAPHSHPGIFQLILIERGGGRLTADGQSVSLVPRALVTIPSGSIHGFAFAEDAEGWVLSIALPLLTETGLSSADQTTRWASSLDERMASRLGWSLRTLAEDAAGSRGWQGDGAGLALLRLIFALAGEAFGPNGAGPVAPAGTEARHQALVRRFRGLVDRHYRSGWSTARYATELGASTATLMRACKAVLGQPPGDVVLDRIQLEAMRALTFGDAGITRIAHDLGFTDPAYFSRFFRKRTGLTPRDFRARRGQV